MLRSHPTPDLSASGSSSHSVERVCPQCGEGFVDRSRTSPRTYCSTCRPPRQAAKDGSGFVRAAVTGKPFTIDHFRAWSRTLLLRGDVPFVLEGWQAAFLEDVFAGYQECWLIVPEGNGKSTLIAALVLYACEFSEDADIPVAASSRDQAEIIFKQARGFVRRAGMAGFECKPGLREIVFGAVSKAKIFASDAGTGDGIVPAPFEVLDELHRHRSLELYYVWAGKLDKEGAQLVVISTAGAPGSEFEGVRESIRQGAAESFRDGCFGRFVSETAVMHEYAVPEDGDVEDLDLVKAANPAEMITVESLRRKRSRPSWNLPHWRRLVCNLPTRDGTAAIAESEWHNAATADPLPVDEPVWLGFDVGFQHDTTAIVPLWWESGERRLLGPATVLEPPGGGEQLDVRLIKRAFEDLCSRYRVTTVVMDSSRAEDIAAWLSDELGLVVVYRSQGTRSQGEDYERFMAALRQGWLLHSGDMGLRRHAFNAVIKLLPDGGAKFARSSESRSGDNSSRVIDALVAAAMVHSVASEEFGSPAGFEWFDEDLDEAA